VSIERHGKQTRQALGRAGVRAALWRPGMPVEIMVTAAK